MIIFLSISLIIIKTISTCSYALFVHMKSKRRINMHKIICNDAKLKMLPIFSSVTSHRYIVIVTQIHFRNCILYNFNFKIILGSSKLRFWVIWSTEKFGHHYCDYHNLLINFLFALIDWSACCISKLDICLHSNGAH